FKRKAEELGKLTEENNVKVYIPFAKRGYEKRNRNICSTYGSTRAEILAFSSKMVQSNVTVLLPIVDDFDRRELTILQFDLEKLLKKSAPRTKILPSLMYSNESETAAKLAETVKQYPDVSVIFWGDGDSAAGLLEEMIHYKQVKDRLWLFPEAHFWIDQLQANEIAWDIAREIGVYSVAFLGFNETGLFRHKLMQHLNKKLGKGASFHETAAFDAALAIANADKPSNKRGITGIIKFDAFGNRDETSGDHVRMMLIPDMNRHNEGIEDFIDVLHDSPWLADGVVSVEIGVNATNNSGEERFVVTPVQHATSGNFLRREYLRGFMNKSVDLGCTESRVKIKATDSLTHMPITRDLSPGSFPGVMIIPGDHGFSVQLQCLKGRDSSEENVAFGAHFVCPAKDPSHDLPCVHSVTKSGNRISSGSQVEGNHFLSGHVEYEEVPREHMQRYFEAFGFLGPERGFQVSNPQPSGTFSRTKRDLETIETLQQQLLRGKPGDYSIKATSYDDAISTRSSSGAAENAGAKSTRMIRDLGKYYSYNTVFGDLSSWYPAVLAELAQAYNLSQEETREVLTMSKSSYLPTVLRRDSRGHGRFSWFIDSQFGAKLKTRDANAMLGYHALATPIVWGMKQSLTFSTIVDRVAKPWIHQMAFEEGLLESGSHFGEIFMNYGVPLCSWVGTHNPTGLVYPAPLFPLRLVKGGRYPEDNAHSCVRSSKGDDKRVYIYGGHLFVDGDAACVQITRRGKNGRTAAVDSPVPAKSTKYPYPPYAKWLGSSVTAQAACMGASLACIFCTLIMEASGVASFACSGAYSQFGAKLKTRDANAMLGYHALATPIVWGMKQSLTFSTIVDRVAKPWIHQVAFEEGLLESGSHFGEVFMNYGARMQPTHFACWHCRTHNPTGLVYPAPLFPLRLVKGGRYPEDNAHSCVRSSKDVLLRSAAMIEDLGEITSLNECRFWNRFWLWDRVQVCACTGAFCNTGNLYRYEVITNAVNNAPLGVRPVPENEYPVFEKPERGDISTQLACWTCSSVKQDLLPKDGLPEITTKLDGFSECKPYLQGVFDQATSEFGEITRFDPEDNAHCLVIESVDVYRYEVITNAVNNAPLGVRPVPENEYPVFDKPERGDISTQLACWTCSSVKQDLLPKDGLPEITTKLDGFSECKPYLQGVFDQATSEFGEITRFDPEDNAHCLVIESVDGIALVRGSTSSPSFAKLQMGVSPFYGVKICICDYSYCNALCDSNDGVSLHRLQQRNPLLIAIVLVNSLLIVRVFFRYAKIVGGSAIEKLFGTLET
ncbi:unnamed protein product, partial [Notodromas monacha]